MANPLLLCKTKRQKIRVRQHDNAEQRLHEELDCVKIIKAIRELKMVTKLILSQHQRQLLAFNSFNVISDQPNAQPDEEQLEDWMPFAKSDELRRATYQQKVEDIVEYWEEGDITEIDRKLINEITNGKSTIFKSHQIVKGIIFYRVMWFDINTILYIDEPGSTSLPIENKTIVSHSNAIQRIPDRKMSVF